MAPACNFTPEQLAKRFLDASLPYSDPLTGAERDVTCREMLVTENKGASLIMYVNKVMAGLLNSAFLKDPVPNRYVDIKGFDIGETDSRDSLLKVIDAYLKEHSVGEGPERLQAIREQVESYAEVIEGPITALAAVSKKLQDFSERRGSFSRDDAKVFITLADSIEQLCAHQISICVDNDLDMHKPIGNVGRFFDGMRTSMETMKKDMALLGEAIRANGRGTGKA